MGSDSYFELLHLRVKSVQAPTISGQNIDRIQTKQAGYPETVYCSCTVTKRCQQFMKTLCGLCCFSQCFCTAQQTIVRAAADLAKAMAVGTAKNQDRGTQHIPAAVS